MNRFIKTATMLFKSNDDIEKKVFNASRKAENHLNQVISKLNSEIIDAEISLEEANERLQACKYSIDWLEDPTATLRIIDQVEEQVKNAAKKLKDLKYSLNLRQALLAEYKQEIEK